MPFSPIAPWLSVVRIRAPPQGATSKPSRPVCAVNLSPFATSKPPISFSQSLKRPAGTDPLPRWEIDAVVLAAERDLRFSVHFQLVLEQVLRATESEQPGIPRRAPPMPRSDATCMPAKSVPVLRRYSTFSSPARRRAASSEIILVPGRAGQRPAAAQLDPPVDTDLARVPASPAKDSAGQARTHDPAGGHRRACRRSTP